MNTQLIKVPAQQTDRTMLLIQSYSGGKIQSIPKDVFEKIMKQILSRLHLLAPETDYTSIELCTKQFWENELGPEEHKCAGKYIALMVSTGKLPLQPNGINLSSKAKLYRLK